MTPYRAGRPAALDEREFHAWLAHFLRGPGRGLLPLGDDAAALRVPPRRVAVLSTDALVEGTHFLPDSPPLRIGAAAANVSLSDVAAKGAEPAALLLDLIVPRGTPRRWAQEVVRGADRAGRRAGAPLVGGDTKPGATPAVVSTVIGWGRPGHLAPREGARPGDLLVTTGSVGRGGLAAHHLGRSAPSRARRRTALVELLTVHPRVREGIALAPFAHAMLDTSDGLADASGLMSEASGVAVTVEEALLPWTVGLARAAPTARGRRALGFYGGDYELLAAVPSRAAAPARSAVRAVGGRLTVIGRVERGQGAYLERAGRRIPMPAGGWRPFRKRRNGLP
jgi:thiamine-monophosphate kinase